MEKRLMALPGTSFLRRPVFSFFAALLVLPLIYLSCVRLVSQFIVSTDVSSLWGAPVRPARATSHSLAVLARLDPFTPDYPYRMADRLSGEDPVEALRLNRKAISLSVLSPQYRIQKGKLDAQRGNFREAFQSFEKAIFLDPGDVDAYVQKGLFLFFQVLPNVESERKGDCLAMAEQSLSLAAKYDPYLLRSPPLAFVLASIYSERGDQDEARAILQKADESVGPDLKFLVRKWALHFQLGDTKRPISQWDHLFREGKLTPGELTTLADEMVKFTIPDFSYFMAQIHLQRGETDMALQKLSSCVSARPHVAEYRLALGDVYEKLGKSRDALIQFEKALELSPTNQFAKSKVIEYYKRR